MSAGDGWELDSLRQLICRDCRCALGDKGSVLRIPADDEPLPLPAEVDALITVVRDYDLNCDISSGTDVVRLRQEALDAVTNYEVDGNTGYRVLPVIERVAEAYELLGGQLARLQSKEENNQRLEVAREFITEAAVQLQKLHCFIENKRKMERGY